MQDLQRLLLLFIFFFGVGHNVGQEQDGVHCADAKKTCDREEHPEEAKMLKDEVTTVNPQRSEEIDECVNNQEPD